MVFPIQWGRYKFKIENMHMDRDEKTVIPTSLQGKSRPRNECLLQHSI